MGLLDKSGAPLFGEEPTPQLVLPGDTDLRHDSPHHTLGLGPTQAAAGNHNHDDRYDARYDARYVNIDGDTMTDSLIIAKSTEPSLKLRAPAGVSRSIKFENDSGLGRWTFYADNAAESGSNAGSDLRIGSYTDAGAWGGTRLAISRANGAVTIYNNLEVQDGLTFDKCINLASGTNLNNLRKSGFYDGSGLTNAVTSGWWYYIHLEHSLNGTSWRRQIAFSFDDARFVYTRTMQNGSWQSWFLIGTYSSGSKITPASGWTNYGGAWATGDISISGEVVTGAFLYKPTSTVSVTAGAEFIIGNMPTGWIPTKQQMLAGIITYSGGTNAPCRINLNPSGTIGCQVQTSGTVSTTQWVGASVSYNVVR